MEKRNNNLSLKLATLVVAILLWSYVMSEVNPIIRKEFKNITVNYLNVQSLERQGLVIMSPESAKVNVEITGKKKEVDKVLASNIYAEVDLTGYGEGQVRVPITVELLNNTADVIVSNISPQEVLFTLEKTITKEITITPETIGEMDEKYVVGDIVSEPETIIIRGPRSWVNEVDRAVATVDVTNKTKDFTDTVPIKLLNSEGEEVVGVEKEPNFAKLTVPILQTKELPVELVIEGDAPVNTSITNILLNPSTVKVKGYEQDLNLLENIKTKPVDINQLLDTNMIEVELDLPEGIELVDPTIKVSATYTLEEMIEKTFEIKLSEMKILNLSQDLKLDDESLEKSVKVTVKGLKNIIDEINKDDLTPTVDLDNLTEGTHQVTLTWPTVENIIISKVDPETLNISLINN
ncbi:MAG TPA: CdaR family protein [Soehngenia sp.]|nr:CdaR family protein [Soehngenia sp.]